MFPDGNLRTYMAGVADVWSCVYGPPACGFVPTGGFVVGGTGDGFGESDGVCGVRTDRPSPLVLWSTYELDAIRFRNACVRIGVHVVPGE